MPAITVNIAVFHEGKILLTKRDDFEAWCLPSGGVEDGESAAQAAIRETREETGLIVELKSLVGIYSRIGVLPDIHAVLFTAVPIGGTIQTQPGETIEVRFFSIDEIPEDLSPGHRRRIEDAVKGIGGSTAVLQDMILPAGQKLSNRELAQLRNQPRESRLKLYQQFIEKAVIHSKTEVGEDDHSNQLP